MQILYVEDDKFDQLAFKRILKKIPSISVEIATSHNEMREKVEVNAYDIIIRDIYLNGAKNLDTPGNIPVYFTSGSKPVLEQLSKKSIDSKFLLLKPIRLQDVQKIVTDYTNISTEPDFSQIDEWADGDEHFKNELITYYLDEIPSQIQKIEEVALEGDLKKLADLLHAVLTKLRTFGFHDLVNKVSKLEYNARNNDLAMSVCNQRLEPIIIALHQTRLTLRTKRIT
jgi:HPt (histidine-containing phosphotransfer) domain-containing protein